MYLLSLLSSNLTEMKNSINSEAIVFRLESISHIDIEILVSGFCCE